MMGSKRSRKRSRPVTISCVKNLVCDHVRKEEKEFFCEI